MAVACGRWYASDAVELSRSLWCFPRRHKQVQAGGSGENNVRLIRQATALLRRWLGGGINSKQRRRFNSVLGHDISKELTESRLTLPVRFQSAIFRRDPAFPVSSCGEPHQSRLLLRPSAAVLDTSL